MTLERGLVVIGGPLALVSGLACALMPATLAAWAGLEATASGLTDMRAIYGGLQIGLGGFLLWCARDEARTRAGVVALGLALGAVGGVRMLGLALDGDVNAFHLANLAFELGTAALVSVALLRPSEARAAVR